MSTERNRFKNWVKEIPLTKGMVALVDQSDYEILNQWKWGAQKSGTTYYAARSITINGKRVTIMMHRAILTAPAGKLIDHINHNGLDNRKSNLRIATPTQNKQNKNIQFNNTSGFKGVSFYDGRWCANISVNSKQRLISKHYSPEEAARAYDAKAIEMQGEFACTNVKLGLLPPVKYSPIQALGSSQQDPIAVEVCGIIRNLLLKECPEIPCPAFLDDHVANLVFSYKKLKAGQQVENGDKELIKGLVDIVSDVDYVLRNIWALDRKKLEEEFLPRTKAALAKAAINGVNT